MGAPMTTRSLPAVTGSLGPFETDVMEVLWSLGREASVRDVRAALLAGPAYTTVMTTMERLHRKGLLHRQRQGRAFLYTPTLTRDGLAGRRTGKLVGQLLDGGVSAAPVLSSFVNAVSEHDRALLDHLEELIRQKKEEL
jgi:predicted transcriptional regulator